MTYELRKTDENVLIAEGASVTGDVRLAKGVSIWYGAVLRGGSLRGVLYCITECYSDIA